MKTNIPLANAPHYHHHGAMTPTAMLREEHEVILRALALLEQFGRQMEAGEPANREGIQWLKEFFGTFANRCHHSKEEQHLFPAMERHGIPREEGPIGVMLSEHEEGRAFLRAMAKGDDRETAEAIRGYTALLRVHIEKENGVLFPMAKQVLPEEEQERLIHDFEAVEQAVAAPGVHERLPGRARRDRREGASGTAV